MTVILVHTWTQVFSSDISLDGLFREAIQSASFQNCGSDGYCIGHVHATPRTFGISGYKMVSKESTRVLFSLSLVCPFCRPLQHVRADAYSGLRPVGAID